MEVRIYLSGRGYLFGQMETAADSGDICEFGTIQEDVCVVAEIDGEQEDITDEKGKYVTDNTFINEHYHVVDEAPYYYRKISRPLYYDAAEFVIECEEFDPSKLQLIKVVNTFPLDGTTGVNFGIMVDTILYDGEEIQLDTDCESYDELYEFSMQSFNVYVEEEDGSTRELTQEEIDEAWEEAFG